VQPHRIGGLPSIQPPSAAAVVEGGSREKPVDVAVLQEVAGWWRCFSWMAARRRSGMAEGAGERSAETERERARVRQAIGAELDLGFACVSRLWAGGCWARDCWAVACLQNLTIFESSMNCTSPL
jgi:hypothetical protein